MATLSELQGVANLLHPSQLDLLVSMAKAMSMAIEEWIEPTSDILTPEFNVHFSNRLVMHHATHDELFKKKSFEYAFCGAARAAGRQASITSNPTNPGSDVKVDGTTFSLKTEAAKNMSQSSIKISKLMEARWIRDCNTQEDFARTTSARVGQHLKEYERILMLRAFDLNQHVRYDLVEIPRNLLLLVCNLVAEDFEPRRKKSGGSTARVRMSGQTVFSIRLDGSVEKITIDRLLVASCISHGSWKIPKKRYL